MAAKAPALKKDSGILYVVATPIGNMADITLRAIQTLKTVDLVAAEDTRHTRRLLTYHQIRKPLVSYHEHNEIRRSETLVERLLSGESVALVSNAGTP
ncbi:MAG: SAM-dependent methyltransferase, partial [Deltaproteobacteria bacterium]